VRSKFADDKVLELAIRTSQLLLKLEQTFHQEISHSGKAVVIGSWIR